MAPQTNYRLTLVSPYGRLAALTEQLAPEYDFDISVLRAVLEEVRTIHIDDLPTRPEILLSRGGTAEYLRDSFPDIPVISINTSALDLMISLQPFVAPEKTVIFANFGRKLDGVQDIARVLGCTIVEFVYETHGELVDRLRRARREGVHIAAGGQLVLTEAERLGLTGVLVEAGVHAVREALREASSVARMRRWLNQHNAYLRTVIDNVAEGVIVTDENDRVRLINSMAERLLQTTSEAAAGAPIKKIIPTSAIPEVRQSAQPEIGELLHVADRTLVANRVPIVSGDGVVGVVCTLTDGGRIQKAEQRIRSQMRQRGFVAHHSFEDIITVDEQMLEAKRLAAIYARGHSSILLQGETGTGKELFAHAIHRASSYGEGPFVAVNCAAIPESLLESELFGYEEGAFTGARRKGKEGLFEIAHRGTIFLDEIGELPSSLQARLLRVLQEREVMRVGGTQIVPIDVRVISATNRNLAEGVHEGHFRRDLFYRLNVLTVNIPPLRERRKDIENIGFRLLREQVRQKGIDRSLEECLIPLLLSHSWPGNIRELQNTVERVALVANMCPDMAWPEIIKQTWATFEGAADRATSGVLKLAVPPVGNLKDMIRHAEGQIIRHYMLLNANDQTRVSVALGISRMSLWRRLHNEEDAE